MPRKSRGCASCRQRRIGCDGGIPSCRQCLITNRKCSGPLQGPIIIDQTQNIITSQLRRREYQARSTRAMVKQPPTTLLVAMNLISEFLSFITARDELSHSKSWLVEIQRGSLNSIDKTNPQALELAIQATALAYCGYSCRNTELVRYGREIYSHALTQHYETLSRGRGTSPTITIICTSMILSIFESMCSTNTNAYGTHLIAAKNMLPMIDDTVKQHQAFRQLEGHVHCQKVKSYSLSHGFISTSIY